MPRLLELFSGTGSVGRAFADLGWEVVSVDLDRNARPTICENVLDWDWSTWPSGSFDVIWASPPCQQYSCARTRGPPPDLEGADRLVEKSLEIIDFFEPRWWWIENPATGLLHTRPCIQRMGAPYLVSYCRYGFPYRKNTHLWSNCPHLAPKVCRKDCAFFENGRHPLSAQRGPNKGQRRGQLSLSTLYRIPADLCADIAEASSGE